jgi:hypothetical protein
MAIKGRSSSIKLDMELSYVGKQFLCALYFWNLRYCPFTTQGSTGSVQSAAGTEGRPRISGNASKPRRCSFFLPALQELFLHVSEVHILLGCFGKRSYRLAAISLRTFSAWT